MRALFVWTGWSLELPLSPPTHRVFCGFHADGANISNQLILRLLWAKQSQVEIGVAMGVREKGAQCINNHTYTSRCTCTCIIAVANSIKGLYRWFQIIVKCMRPLHVEIIWDNQRTDSKRQGKKAQSGAMEWSTSLTGNQRKPRMKTYGHFLSIQ